VRRPLSWLILSASSVALAAATGSTVVPDSADARSKCSSPSSRTLYRTAAGRFFDKRTGVYACSSRFGRKFRLVEEDFQQDYGPFRLTPGFAAYGSEFDCAACENQFATVNVMNLRTGRHRFRASASSVPEADDRRTEDVTDLVLKRNGATAWIVVVGGSTLEGQPIRLRQVHARDGAGARVLDSGPDAIQPQSLELSGSTVSWTGEGGGRTATLR